MRKTEAGNGKGLKCQNCREPYGWAEYFDYMTSLRSTTIDCFTCPEENYVVPGSFFKFLPLRVICWIIPLFIAGGFIYGLSDIEFYENEIYFDIPGYTIAFALLLAITSYFILIKSLHWFTGTLSMDKTFKSDSDYDIY